MGRVARLGKPLRQRRSFPCPIAKLANGGGKDEFGSAIEVEVGGNAIRRSQAEKRIANVGAQGQSRSHVAEIGPFEELNILLGAADDQHGNFVRPISIKITSPQDADNPVGAC